MPKRVLIITYYWPPAGGPGVQRWLKFAKYLPEFGWEPIVFTPENPSYPLIDETLEKEVSPNLKVMKTKIWEPYQWAEKWNKGNKKFKAGQFDIGENQSWKSKISLWVRGNFFIPDARVFWVKPSVAYLKKYLKENPFDALVTTGPPHSLHLIGLGLKKEFPQLKWLADFRDPWTEISYYQYLKLTSWADHRHRKLEREVLQSADITLATSFTDAENFKKKGANAVCITNGFDDEEWQNLEHFRMEKFTLSYVGILEQLRNPDTLWEILEELVEENPDFAQNFELKFAGRVDDRILEKISSMSLSEKINYRGYLTHDRALEEMKKSDLLLLTNFDKTSSKGIIPGKLFEYLATGKKIISFGVKDSDVEKILTETQMGKHFELSQKEEIKNFIWEQYKSWKRGENSQNNSENIQQFSRKNLTKELAKYL
ncbi:MAG: glycosyl transferase family 1 [Flavobacteriaceae bacterium]|nr:glycosyl transferase family 1 [Flavobacteriaceae bacterium]